MQLHCQVNASVVNQLKERTKVESTAELTRDALILLNWATQEAAAGRKIQSVDESGGSPQGFSTPVLSSFPYVGE